MLNAVSNYALQLYHSIPGESKTEKASFVANRAFKILPWVAGEAVAYYYSPSKIRPSLPALAFVSVRLSRSIPIVNMAYGLGAIHFLQTGGISSLNLLRSDTWTDHLRFLAIAYTSFKVASQLMLQIDKNLNPIEQQPQPEQVTPVGIILAIPLQFYYTQQLTTCSVIAGVAIGHFKQTIHQWVLQEGILQSYTPLFTTRYLEPIIPRATMQKCQLIWKIWDVFATSITIPGLAVMNGIQQGMILHFLWNRM